MATLLLVVIFIVLGIKLIKTLKKVDKVMGMIDVAPTLANMLGVKP